MRVITLLFLAACTTSSAWPDHTDDAWSQAVFGVDDRTDYYGLSDPMEVGLAHATAGLLYTSELTAIAGGWRVPSSPTNQDYWDVCPSDPFAQQPVPMYCSGFLVGPDILVTAGHCIAQNDFREYSWVFDYRYDAPGVLNSRVATDDVYTVTQILDRTNNWTVDYAVVQLDRPVTGRAPMPVFRGTPRVGEPVTIAGYPLGMPLKVAGDAEIQSVSSTWFEANVDSFGGNSGSPVMHATQGDLYGIMVRGFDDFVSRGSCNDLYVCSQGGCPQGSQEQTRADEFNASIPPLDFALYVPPTADVGGNFDIAVRGAPANDRVYVVTGTPGGSTSIPGCPGLTTGLTDIRLLAQPRTKRAGNTDLRFTVPGVVAGQTLHMQVASLSTCTLSDVVTSVVN